MATQRSEIDYHASQVLTAFIFRKKKDKDSRFFFSRRW